MASPAEKASTRRTIAERLREPFAPEAIDKLPKGVDDSKPKASCKVCGGYHYPASMHLDYVGHARVTERLLDVDPEWNWEPAGLDEHGQPVLARDTSGVPYGLWIKLTVGGVTRWGFGELPARKGADGVKEAIGDAIRNAAMRFGVALALWYRDHGAPEPARQASPKPRRAASSAEDAPVGSATSRVAARLGEAFSGDVGAIRALLADWFDDYSPEEGLGALEPAKVEHFERLLRYVEDDELTGPDAIGTLVAAEAAVASAPAGAADT